MSYLDKARDPTRSAQAMIAVGAIHAALAYLLVSGLGTTIIETFAKQRIVTTDVRQDPPPTPDEPKPTPQKPQVAQKPVAPVAPLDLVPDRSDPVDPVDPFDSGTAGDIRIPEPPYVPVPDPPVAKFVPKSARPSNRSTSWLSDSDYPRRALVAEAEGSGRYRLIVGTTGRVSSCEMLTSTGNRDLDEATCRLITRRARFEPATDETGAKVMGSYSGSVNWTIPD